jgi:hypothetical protein
MNARTLVVALVVACCLRVAGAEQDAGYSLLDGVGRGFANLFTGAIELPRCMTFYAVQWPAVGAIPGAIQGAGMTAVRAIGGVVDLFTVGYLEPGNTVYDAMEEPLFPWQALWLPTSDDEMASRAGVPVIAAN